ncbi:MAG: hypothetical protein ACYTHK_13305 [Planctomycetota bacterium]
MRRFGVVLLCLAGLEAAEPRTPLRPPGGPLKTDVVTRQLYTLLAGKPVRHRALAFVPLHARSPALARRTGAKLPLWSADGLEVSSPLAGALHLRHRFSRPLLVTPGRAWTVGKVHLRALECALVEPESSAFLRVTQGASPARHGPAWIDATATGALLADPARAAPVATYRTQDISTGSLYHACERLTRHFGQSGDRTIVGCVGLVGGEPVVAFVFGDRPVFAEARPDLIAATIVSAQRRVAAGAPEVLLRQRAERANARGVSVAMLRALCDTRRRSRGVPGGGAHWRAGSRAAGHVGHALVDAQARLVFFGAWQVPKHGIKPNPTRPGPVESDPEEDRRRKKSGRFNPLRGGKDPLLPPTLPGR